MEWPPDLPTLKVDMKIPASDERDDAQLEQVLGAAVDFVRRVHRGRFNFDGDPESDLPDPDRTMILGTLALARRWHTRRRSPDGMVDMGELGAGRVSSGDVDIDRQLRIGRFRWLVFG